MPTKLSYLTFILFILFLSTSHAAELSGRLTGIPDAVLSVQCPGGSGASKLSQDGAYAVMDLPSGQSCTFTVSSGNIKSVPIPFNTSRSVTIFNGQLRQHNDWVVVIRR